MSRKKYRDNWVKWYWQDYLSEAGLQLCSLAARGLWVEMLAIMTRASNKGYLQIGKVSVDNKMLAKLVRADEKLVSDLLSELESHTVFSRTKNGKIFCRRLVREAEISRKRALAVSVRWEKNLYIQNECKNDTKAIHDVDTRSASASASASNNKEKGGVGEKEKEIIGQWNEFAAKHGLPKINGIIKGSKREIHLRARMADKDFDFQKLLGQIERCPFLLGQKTDFRATFDWIICPSNYQKIMDGNYLDQTSQRLQDIERWANEEQE